jgi:hypothetical protein
VKAFFVASAPRWSLNQNPSAGNRKFSAGKLKDQPMKIRLPRLAAFASLLSVTLCSVGPARATTITENFTGDPAASGWSVHGNSNLFAWSAANQNLEVTWDSSQPNSYFHRSFEFTLSKTNDFLLAFDLRLTAIAGGVDANKPYPFQIAVGLMNLAQATSSTFIRGSGYESPNLVEFDYFPGAIFDPTVSPVLISTNNEFNEGGFTFPLELAPGALFRVTMRYTARDQTLRTFITNNGVPFGPVKDATLGAGFSDFLVDHMTISSYSDAGQFPGFEGSVLAHGVIDSLVFAAPPPVTWVTAIGPGEIQFGGTTNWLYHLERSTNFQSWLPASAIVAGDEGPMTMQDTNPPSGGAFYRVQACLP